MRMLYNERAHTHTCAGDDDREKDYKLDDEMNLCIRSYPNI